MTFNQENVIEIESNMQKRILARLHKEIEVMQEKIGQSLSQIKKYELEIKRLQVEIDWIKENLGGING